MATPKIQTVVTNPTASSRYYGYLGPRGARLAAAASKTFTGDIRQTMTPQELAALADDEDNSRITVRLVVVGSPLDSTNGAAAGTGVTATEGGDAGVHQTVLTLVDTPLPMVDAAGVVAYAGLKVYDFPAGNIQFLGATINLALTKSSAGVIDTWDGDVALGTATASNNATLTLTEADLVPSTATPQAVDGATTAKAISTSTEGAKIFNGTSTAIDAFLNVLVDDTDHDVTTTPCNLIANGTITILWANTGDI